MAGANGKDLSAMERWYEQAGTPELEVSTEYDAAAKTFTLKCKQRTPPTRGQEEKVRREAEDANGLSHGVGGMCEEKVRREVDMASAGCATGGSVTSTFGATVSNATATSSPLAHPPHHDQPFHCHGLW